ncbi:MAG: response regulator [Alphaproteobacteria bacterium]|nr:response regulator [Alphaproteobacteria bacterium]
MALFERISLLVVEDEEFMLGLLKQVLFAAGFRNVRTARDGQEAIAFLASYRNMRGAGGAMMQPVDVVLTDTDMPNINGIDLLRWIRRDAGSPNRFLPVVMVAGEADAEMILACRDVGVSEIVAKPYSLASLLQKIMAVIERPRPYILARSYFGPDRRRQKAAVEGKDRRVGADKVKRFTTAQGNLSLLEGYVFQFDIPNALKPKLDGVVSGVPVDYSAELAKAQDALAAADTQIKDWIVEAVTRLENQFKKLAKGEDVAPTRGEMNALARELRGHGGTFGYPLISEFSRSLDLFLERLGDLHADALELIRAHVDVIKVVVKQNARHANDPLAREIKLMLEKVIAKYSSKHGAMNLSARAGARRAPSAPAPI